MLCDVSVLRCLNCVLVGRVRWYFFPNLLVFDLFNLRGIPAGIPHGVGFCSWRGKCAALCLCGVCLLYPCGYCLLCSCKVGLLGL